jgi:purine-binding chemotaxis protein CheW
MMAGAGWSEIRKQLVEAQRSLDLALSPPRSVSNRILRERAVQSARLTVEGVPGESIEVVAFRMANETYAVETSFVREVCPLTNLTPVPCTPALVLGVINLRGEICPVVDLKRLFGMPARGLTNVTRAVIVRDARREFGIVADVVLGIRSVPVSRITPPPPVLRDVHARFLRGLTDEGMVILDAASVLGDSAFVVNELVER